MAMEIEVNAVARSGKWLATVAVVLLLAACAGAPQRKLANLVALRQQAADAYAQGRYARALGAYRTLADRLPDDIGVWFRLGNVYARLNQPQQAGMAYRHVLQRDPAHARAWHNLGVVYLHQSEAAFVQSARTADADAPLRKQSLGMASRLDATTRASATKDDVDGTGPAARATSTRAAASAVSTAGTVPSEENGS